MKIKIAVVQFEIAQFSAEKNIKKAEKYIQKAAREKANIIVFPEDFITGPIVGREEHADNENKYRKKFQKLAKKYKIDIVPGSIIEQDGKGMFNTAHYINSSGIVKSKYRKINLWIPEREYLRAGSEISVFNTKYGKIGLMICWDMIYPEMFRAMAKKGVQIVICPSYWCKGDAYEGIKYNTNSEIELVNSISVARAFENEIFFVYCNAAGKFLVKGMAKDELIGRTQITGPFLGCIKRLDHNKEEMFIQEIDTSLLKTAEKVYKIRNDLKKGIRC